MMGASVPHGRVHIQVQQAVHLQIYEAWLVPASWHQSKGGNLALGCGDAHSPGTLAEWTLLPHVTLPALFPPPGPLPKDIKPPKGRGTDISSTPQSRVPQPSMCHLV